MSSQTDELKPLSRTESRCLIKPGTTDTKPGGSDSKKKEIAQLRSEYTTSIFATVKNIFKNTLMVSCVYLFGYFNLSFAWLLFPIIFTVVKDDWKKSGKYKRELAKATALTSEKEMILARLDDLPAWVFFPDMERAEWINQIMFQMWPNINHYAQDMIKTVVEPKLQETLANYKVTGFQFDKLRLGTIPPRIGGIKVYDKYISRREIMMDIDLCYAGDCDISFRLKGVSGGVKDFQIQGMMRVIMKPLIPTIPLIGGLQIFFLNNPSIDFNLVGAIDVLDIPGISDIVRKVIIEQISNMMVLPNMLPIVLSDVIPAPLVKMPQPKGVLRLQLVQAVELMKMDVGIMGKGKSDPYVIVTVGASQYRTKTIDNTVEPKWDEWCDFIIFEPNDQLVNLHVYDQDDVGSKDDDLGKASLELNNVVNNGELDVWKKLEGVKHGTIHVRLFWYELSENADDLKAAQDELKELKVTSANSSLVVLYLDSLQNLPDAKPNVRPDPVVTITAVSNTKSTGIQFRTNSPVYEQGFSFLIHNPRNDVVSFKVTDSKSKLDLGVFDFSLNSLLKRPDLKQDIEPFSLQKSGPNSKILLAAHLKVLKRCEKQTSDVITLQSMMKANSTDRHDSVQSVESQIVSENQTADIWDVEDNVFTPKNGTLVPQKSVTESHKSYSSDMAVLPNPITGPSILLTLTHKTSTQHLVVTVHGIRNLPAKDPHDLPDPYVKLYLLPKHQETKRKTKVIKDSCNPVYEETFEYQVSHDEIPYRQLSISVISQKTSFMSRQTDLGKLSLELKEIEGLKESHKEWYPLVMEHE